MSASSQTAAIDRATLPASDCFNSDLIQIDVGPENKRRIFRVHESVLCHYSGYFKGALRGDFIEAKTKHIELATEDPNIFTMFVYWLYTRRMSPSIPTMMVKNSDFLPLCQLWVFADARSIPLLQDDAMDALIQAVDDSHLVPVGHITYVYSKTLPGSPLRRVFIDLVSKLTTRDVLKNPKQSWTQEALIDLADALWANQKVVSGKPGAEKIQRSEYYVVDRNK